MIVSSGRCRGEAIEKSDTLIIDALSLQSFKDSSLCFCFGIGGEEGEER